jgi:hypothetical protein
MAGPKILQLTDYPTGLVRLACARCHLKERHWKEMLIAQYGSKVRLFDLRLQIVKCPRRDQPKEHCRAYYEDLLPRDG